MSKNWQWSEFEWEREIRRDDQRICSYFETLPDYLDLPGEEEAIFRKLSSQKELAPVHGGNWWQSLSSGDHADSEEEDEEAEESAFDALQRVRGRVGFELFCSLQESAQEWNAFSCEFFDHTQAPMILNICSLYGITLSRLNNFMNLDKTKNNKGLKCSLLKRIVKDLNLLIERFIAFKAEYDSEASFEQFFARLCQNRDQVVDILFAEHRK